MTVNCLNWRKQGKLLKMKKLRVELEIEEFFHLELAKLVNILRKYFRALNIVPLIDFFVLGMRSVVTSTQRQQKYVLTRHLFEHKSH